MTVADRSGGVGESRSIDRHDSPLSGAVHDGRWLRQFGTTLRFTSPLDMSAPGP